MTSAIWWRAVRVSSDPSRSCGRPACPRRGPARRRIRRRSAETARRHRRERSPPSAWHCAASAEQEAAVLAQKRQKPKQPCGGWPAGVGHGCDSGSETNHVRMMCDGVRTLRKTQESSLGASGVACRGPLLLREVRNPDRVTRATGKSGKLLRGGAHGNR